MDSQYKVRFWEKKIQEWENARYEGNYDDLPLLSRIVKRGSYSIRFRMDQAAVMLAPHMQDRVLLDIGTGSGILIQKLKDTSAKGFIGVDIAPRAIEDAKALAQKEGYADRSTFFAGNVLDLDLPDFDVVSALGLIDWLEDDELEKMVEMIQGKLVYISYSEHNLMSLSQWVHKTYVQVSYGWRSKGYIPKYHRTEWLIALFEKYGFTNLKVYRHPKLAFAAVLHNLPD